MTPEAKLLRLPVTDKETAEMYAILNAIAGKLDALCDDHSSTRQMIENHMAGEDHLIKLFKDGFPYGDPVLHKQIHEEQLEQAKIRKEFWQKLTFELAKWGLIGFCGWLVLQIWSGALKGPQ